MKGQRIMGGRNRAVGAYGERVAARRLLELGYEILATNWRCREGEVDIIALDGTCLVVVEVKTRTSDRFGSPIEAITPRKAARLRRLAGTWLAQHPHVASRRVRIDIVGVRQPPRGAAEVTHLMGV
ncbi:putative endonuclease [Kineosphaera limosa]|nr:YraN family protein [Kineosphaera limosa]NYD99414.1 putative endonuclease [Kineosphaera limosa]